MRKPIAPRQYPIFFPMPRFRFPNPFRSRPAKRPVVDSTLSRTQPGIPKGPGEGDSRDLSKPTSGEYAGEAARNFFNALEFVADEIPVPGLSTAVKLATKLIEACDDSHATLERAQELKQRIKALVTVLVDDLKGKKAVEIQEELKKDIQHLEEDLKYIQTKLDAIASQHALLLFLFQSLNEGKVDKCLRVLDNAVTRFKLSRDVKSAILLDKIEKEIINFHAEQQRTLTDIREELRETNSNMGEILDILHGRRTADAAKSRAQSRPSMPAPINVFYGRSGVVDEVVEFLTKPSDTGMRPRACLCGPGGMGKTSTALAIMADPRLRASFPPRNQVWVPCVKATSVSLFLDTLYSSLAPVQNTGNPLEDVMSEIETTAEPLILLLDNFETLWNLTDSRSNVEDILNRLDKTNVTLLMTTRSSAAPLSGNQWQSFSLEAIDDDSARKIYSQIVPQSDKDPKVPDLLKALGCMPLAVTLMARRGKTTGLDAQKLLDEYNRRGTALLGTAGNGMDARQSLDVCISLSVQSRLILDTPRAYELLVTLAMLPAGTDHQTLSDCWATPANFPNLFDALEALSQTSLLERRQTHYFVLPVIRSYVLDPSRFSVAVSDAVVASACRFLRGHTTFPGDPSFHEHAKALSAEESNLQAILLRMKSEAPRDDMIEAFLILADYQLMTRLKLEVIEHLVRLSCDGAVPQSLVGKVRTCYGKILMELGHLDKAEAEFNSARKIFLEAADNRRAARSTLFLVELRTRLHNVPSPERFGLIKDVRNAKALLKNFDDDNARDTALLNYYYGMICGSTGYHDQGISYLTEAKKSFSALSDTLYGAKCSHWLQLLYYLERRYDVAQDQGNLAIKDFEQLGQYSGDAMQVLGRVLFAKESYKEALETLTGALELCRSYGRTLDLAKTLEMIGRTWAKMGQIGDAREAYEKSQTYYGQVDGDKDYKLRCDFLSRQTADPSLLPTEEERSKLKVRYADF